MKSLLIPIIALLSFTLTYSPGETNDATESTSIEILENRMWGSNMLKFKDTVGPASIEISKLKCKGTETCSCVAAGGCSYDPGSNCRIEFCSGTVDEDDTNSTPKNVTVVKQPCKEGG